MLYVVDEIQELHDKIEVLAVIRSELASEIEACQWKLNLLRADAPDWSTGEEPNTEISVLKGVA